MKTIKIREIATTLTDYVANGSFAALHDNVKYQKSGYARLIRLVDYNKNFSEDDSVWVDEHAYNFLSKSKLFGGEIIISNVGEYAGKAFICPKLPYPMSLAPNSIMLKTNEDDLFYYYYFVSEKGYQTIRTIVNSSGQPKFNKTNFKELEIPHISIVEQNKISSYLSTIDEKILINKSIIDASEKLLREVYEYWFVQFDFPDENGCPYKTAGGEMVYSEKLKREIPKGWRVLKLKDLIKNRTETTTGSHYDRCIDLSIMPSNSLILDKFNYGDTFGSNLKTIKKGDILFGSIRPYLKKAGIAPYDGVRAGTVHCFYPLNKRDGCLCSILITGEDMFQYAIQKSGGNTRMPSVSAKDILDFELAYNEHISSKYNDLLEDISNQIISLINENIKLYELRDWLLPMLISGQVKVQD